MGSVAAKMAWQGGLKFEGTSSFGHKIITDGKKKAGGTEQGARPTEMLLYAIAGCTGIDVVRILEKQRQNVESLEIELVGHQHDECPKTFHTIEVKYIATGTGLDLEKLEKAVELSEGKYCVVSQTIKTANSVTTSCEIRESKNSAPETEKS